MHVRLGRDVRADGTPDDSVVLRISEYLLDFNGR